MTARILKVAFAGLALVWIGCSSGQSHPEAPDFAHLDLDGRTVRLSELRGRTVVIDFFATWCEPCVLQPPELNQVWRAYRDTEKLVVLGIEVGGATAEEVRAWGVENSAEAEYPLLVGGDEDLARRYDISGFPATVIVAPDGTVDSVIVGLSTAAEIEERIAPLLGS
jgi:cytochrome c biogenesis protein CcmG, thiol:disulfide interchange protein DsbE